LYELEKSVPAEIQDMMETPGAGVLFDLEPDTALSDILVFSERQSL